MKLAHLMAGAPSGGAELFFERLCLAQSAAGDMVLPVCRPHPARIARLSALSPVTARFGGWLDVRSGGVVRRALDRFRPEVAIAWMGRAARFAPVGDWVLAGRLGGRYDLARFRRCRHLIANTRGLAGWIAAEGWDPSLVHHLPNFSPDLAGAAPVRPDLPEGARLVLAMGRLHRNKAFDVLIKAIARLSGVHLALAGTGPEEAALRGLARGTGVGSRVHFLGWRSDQAALLAGADLLCCPSRTEPLGNVVLEAFSAGRAVVAARADGPVELIAPDETGVLVPIDDAPALADAIGGLLEDPARAARLAGRARTVFEAQHAEAPVLAGWRRALGAFAQEAAG